MKGFRTTAFNIAMTVIAAVTIINPDAELPTPEAIDTGIDLVEAAVVAVWGVGNLILRAITSSPIFRRD